MTENQRLRELLKEAREELFSLGMNSASAYERGDRTLSRISDQNAEKLHARIDAALAEPTGPERSPRCPGEGTWSVFAEKVVAERDEARAALADAYRRGAEAMRDQAASLFDGGQNVPGLMRSPEFRDVIRALPIPKENP
jgi:cob(I)alamin adenosyltransferase